MTEIVFNSNLTEQKVKENFKDFDMFNALNESLNQVLDSKKGKTQNKTISRKASLPVINVSDIRSSLNMTQKAFAALLGVSPRTVEAWECGRSTPTPTAKKLIYLISQDKSVIPTLQSV